MRRISCLILLLLLLTACTMKTEPEYVIDTSPEYGYDFEGMQRLAALKDELYSHFPPYFSELGHVPGMPVIPAYPEDFGDYFMDHGEYLVILLTDYSAETLERYRSYVSEPEYLGFMRSNYSLNDLIGVYSNISFRKPNIEEELSVRLSHISPNDEGLTGESRGRVAVHVLLRNEEQDQEPIVEYFQKCYGDRVALHFHIYNPEEADPPIEW